MDWIERLFGVNLDSGDGSIELLVVVFLAVVAAVMAARVAVSARVRRRF